MTRPVVFPVVYLFVLLVSTALLNGCTSDDQPAPEQDYILNQNIFLPDANGDGASVADPHVIKVNGVYYLYGTYGQFNLEAWSSTDLINWQYEGVAWAPVPGTWNDKGGIWAPHVEVAPDGCYMYYTANGKIGVAYSPTPDGTFEEVYDRPFIGGGYGGVGDGVYFSPDYSINNPLDLIIDFEEFAIDAFVFRASDGSLTFYLSVATPVTTIAAIPMIDYITLAEGSPRRLLDVQLFSWETIVREGAWVIERDGVFHLMYSGNTYLYEDYAVGVATGPTPMGPFRRRADNPILHKDRALNLSGPGHHSVVEGKYGDLLIFYHSRNNGQRDPIPRFTRYLPMYFDEGGNIQIRK
jgi:hypothetical protein